MKNGFTLVEVLVAVVILSIGILAVSQMTVMGMKTTAVINQRLYARTTMARLFEDLNTRPPDDSLVRDPDGPGDLDDDSIGDFAMTISDSLAKVSYQTLWNVADNIPEPGLKTIRLFVRWGPGDKYRLTSNLIMRM
ncbi:prepilin-type N-terminal cleavage/methylation domain-containing protein [candidate division WOR-3 bacterium]|nr:prepilin-type N-terminal cleavage/methylation domain-containing protein [candidate division WOR-3 bacterium]